MLSPDGRFAVSRRGHDLWARSLSDGREWALTTGGGPDHAYGSGPDSTGNSTLLRKVGLPHPPPAVAWSPDSTKVLTHRTDQRAVRRTHLLEARPPTAARPGRTPSGSPTPGTRTCRWPNWSSWTSPRARSSARGPNRCSCRTCRRSWPGGRGGPRTARRCTASTGPATGARSPCTGWTRPPAR
ncbi:DPP IV N-terminal domain-containing protein [Streptomyces inusitatus]|uniref:DPP IV N-terminal domain-containing protein n=1 Tax=Streptomyces inusitatus TaxID=68221 RepID=UPI003570D6F3